MRWIRIQVDCSPAASDGAAAALLDCGCSGTEHSPEGVAGYLPVTDTLEGRIEDLRGRLDAFPPDFLSPPPEIALSFVEEEDWANAWKEHFHPLSIGRRLAIVPSWCDYTNEERRVVVELDPGMAFGTGAHPSTQLCLRALEETIRGGETVLDWGTGSGILAIAAFRLGAASVFAGDVDPSAVRIARQNARQNRAEDRIHLVAGDRPSILRIQADVVVCNILAGVVIALSGDLAAVTRPGGVLIVSGIIDERAEEVRASLERSGFTEVEIRSQGEWVALSAIRQA